MPDSIPALPPLGQRTPAPPGGNASGWRARPLVVGVVALVVGLAAGLGLGLAWSGGDEPGPVTAAAPSTTTTVPAPSTTAVATLPPECRDAVRAAEQALALLDQGLQTLRAFQLGDLEGVLADMQSLRGRLTDRVRACLERA